MSARMVLLALVSTILGGCADASPAVRGASGTLTVFAAASLTEAFSEMGKVFESSYPGVRVMFSFAGSQTLRTQIEAGAPADVFASANSAEMEALVAGGRIRASDSQEFVSNELVVILPARNPAGCVLLEDLAKPGLRLVLADAEVPVGGYARQSLDKMAIRFGGEFKARVMENVVSNEDNVRQVVAKVQLGEADAGIVYISDAVGGAQLKTIEIPADLNVISRYPIAVLSGTRQPEVAQRFIDFVLSPRGQDILRSWGFGSVI